MGTIYAMHSSRECYYEFYSFFSLLICSSSIFNLFCSHDYQSKKEKPLVIACLIMTKEQSVQREVRVINDTEHMLTVWMNVADANADMLYDEPLMSTASKTIAPRQAYLFNIASFSRTLCDYEEAVLQLTVRANAINRQVTHFCSNTQKNFTISTEGDLSRPYLLIYYDRCS